MIQHRAVHHLILVVEDSDDDYEVLLRAIQKYCDAAVSVHRCETGQDALDYLSRLNSCCHPAPSVHPSFVLLDINLPGIGGRQVLAKVKGDATLRRLPVIVMTTSDDEGDIADCYALGANTYIRKPMSSSHFDDVVRQLSSYWLDVAELPNPQMVR